VAWVLRDARITTVLLGASSVAQLDPGLACLAAENSPIVQS
jgi:aryl-alcohol dehydrogenase-like predicted oxidoreductase